MRILANRLAFLVVATVTLGGIAATTRPADEATDAKKVTLKGTMQCARCSLHEAGVTKCADVLSVKEGENTVNYYITQEGKAKTESHVCNGTKADVSVTGVVSEKEGKHYIAATKIEGGGSGEHAH